MNKLTTFCCCCFLLLSACDQGGGSTVTTTSTPKLLRAIPRSDLTANVTINDKTTSYFGRDYPDDTWVISLDIELEKRYPFTIEWMASNVLVMIQQGTIFASNYEDTINPTLTSVSDGESQFDNDCDNESNLDEIMNNTDPGLPGAADCVTENEIQFSDPVNVVEPTAEEMPDDPNEFTVPRISQPFATFDTEPTNLEPTIGITQYSQPIKVQTSSESLNTAFGVSLRTTTDPIISVGIALHNDPNTTGKNVRFSGSEVTLQPTNVAIANCETFDPARPRCDTPFNWIDKRWYEMVFEEDEVDKTQWRTSIIDTITGETTDLGTVIISLDTVWRLSVVGLVYPSVQGIRASECAQGLPPITVEFKGGTVEERFTLSAPTRIYNEDCVKWGSGASTSSSTNTGGGGADVFRLTLGK